MAFWINELLGYQNKYVEICALLIYYGSSLNIVNQEKKTPKQLSEGNQGYSFLFGFTFLNHYQHFNIILIDNLCE